MIAAYALLTCATFQAEKWDLKPAFEIKAPKQVWNVIVDAQIGEQPHHATFQLTRSVKTITSRRTVATYGWDKLAIDDEKGKQLDGWDVSVGPGNELIRMEPGVDDNIRRMLSPIVFVYPRKDVAVGAKWTSEVNPPGKAAKLTYTYEARAKETVEGQNSLVVDVKLKEDLKDGLSADGTWWLSKSGRIVKFEMSINNWIVPMAGPEPFDAIVRGKWQ